MALAEVNLAQLPPPDVVEPLDFETILAELKADLVARFPDIAARIDLESEPAVKLLETFAWRELLLRQRVNDGARATMLATATGADLDNIGANFGVVRLVLDPGDPNAVPPRDPVLESDDAFRERIRASLYARTTAGPANQYRYIALSAHADVADVSVTSPSPGEVVLAVLSRANGGVPAQAVLDAVLAACNADDVRPLTDHVTVQAAQIVTYRVQATITVYPGPGSDTVLAASQAAVADYCARHFALGHDITRAGLIAAATVDGVQNVNLAEPAADIVVDDLHAANATARVGLIRGSARERYRESVNST